MTYEQLDAVNRKLSTLPIKGKDYVQVNSRVLGFRELYPNGSIETDLVSNIDGVCVMKSTIKDEDGKILATGLAYEKESSSYINKTSYIENCETSAVGRALGMLGIGIDASMCSAEELVNAVTNQEKKSAPVAPAIEEAKLRSKVLAYINRHEYSAEQRAKICAAYKVKNMNDMSAEQCQHYINFIEAKGGNINE